MSRDLLAVALVAAAGCSHRNTAADSSAHMAPEAPDADAGPTTRADAQPAAGFDAAIDARDAAREGSDSARWANSPFVMDTWFWSSNIAVADRLRLVQQLGFRGLALSAGHEVAEYVD